MEKTKAVLRLTKLQMLGGKEAMVEGRDQRVYFKK